MTHRSAVEILRDLLLVAGGGAIGAVSRYLATSSVHDRWGFGFPWGTLMVNSAGCFLIGLIAEVSQTRLLPTATRLFLLTGILGAFTTFSTFGYETLRVYENSGWRWASMNLFANVFTGIIAVVAATELVRWLR